MKVVKHVAGLSAYSRAERHLTRQSSSGAVVTIVGSILAVYLLGSEIKTYVNRNRHGQIVVDVKRREKIRITVNITFPSLPCEVLSLDTLDASGNRGTDVLQGGDINIHKYRLDSQGTRVEAEEYFSPALVQVAETSHGFFLSGESREGQENIDKAMESMGGCNFCGSIDVLRAAGNFHFGVQPHVYFHMKQTQREILHAIRSFQKSSENRSTLPEFEVVHGKAGINVSHIIHEIRFGPLLPNDGVNPLDGSARSVVHNSGTFKYFLKVVPTTYCYSDGRSLESYQFSVHEYFQQSGNGYDVALPSVYFIYDLSPIAMMVVEEKKSLAHLVVKICAVTGGVFAVTGLLDRCIQWSTI